jgi:hypothetical protein
MSNPDSGHGGAMPAERPSPIDIYDNLATVRDLIEAAHMGCDGLLPEFREPLQAVLSIASDKMRAGLDDYREAFINEETAND